MTEAELVIFVRRYGARDVDRTFPLLYTAADGRQVENWWQQSAFQ